MNLQLHLKNVKFPESIENYVSGKIASKVSKLVPNPISADLTISKDRNLFYVKCHVKGSRGVDVDVVESGQSVQEAIDLLADTLHNRIISIKGKKKDKRVSHIRIADRVNPTPPEETTDAEDIIAWERARAQQMAN
jgi:ribosomal subunit interface protein